MTLMFFYIHTTVLIILNYHEVYASTYNMCVCVHVCIYVYSNSQTKKEKKKDQNLNYSIP